MWDKSSQTHITADLVQYVDDMSYDELPSATVESAKRLFLDYIASVYAGFAVNDKTNRMITSVVLNGSAKGRSSVFFHDVAVDPLDAAFINAFYAHGADMDDGNKLAAGHVGCHLISALMALAEERGASVRRFFESMVAGYDIYCRLSAACMPGMVERGFHSTGTAGAIACAAACAKLLGLDRRGIHSAIALSATQASGLLVVGESGQEVKPLNPANAARTGVFSALLAEAGVEGPENPLESKTGWIKAMSSDFSKDMLFDGLGFDYAIDACYVKRYPACRHTHAAIDAAVALGQKVNLSEISSVSITTYGHAIELAGQIDMPKTKGEAKFSIKYATAIALSRGRYSMMDLDPTTLTHEEKMLLNRMEIKVDNDFEMPSKGVRGARIAVCCCDGRRFEETVLVPKGDPEEPFSFVDFVYKFKDSLEALDLSASENEIEEVLSQILSGLVNPEGIFVFPRCNKWERMI